MYVVTEETRLGFTYSRRGILLDPALRDVVDPDEQNFFDWAHNMLQGGVPTHFVDKKWEHRCEHLS